MAKEIRSILRKIDEAILKGDVDTAYKLTKSAVREFDQEKSFADILNNIFNPSSSNSQSNQDGKTCFLFWCW